MWKGKGVAIKKLPAWETDRQQNNHESTPTVSWLMPLTPEEDPCNLEITFSCLHSQTVQADQLVIAADGSLPVSLSSIIERCGLNYVLYQRQHNKGIGAILASAAGLCVGEYIVRIDSDDLYAPEHTAGLVNALNSHPDLGVIGCQLVEIDMENANKVSARRTPIHAGEARQWLPWRNPLNHQTVSIRKRALMEAGGYRDVPGFEDWDLWLRIASLGYAIESLPFSTAAARVDRRHRLRRRGIHYVYKELEFYRLQVLEGRISPGIALMACCGRLPWRIAPTPLLKWWMQSNLRGSPPVCPAWVSKLLSDSSWQPTGRNE